MWPCGMVLFAPTCIGTKLISSRVSPLLECLIVASADLGCFLLCSFLCPCIICSLKLFPLSVSVCLFEGALRRCCVLCSPNPPAEPVTSPAAMSLHHTIDCRIVLYESCQRAFGGCHIIHLNTAIAVLSASRKVTEKGQVAFWRSAML